MCWLGYTQDKCFKELLTAMCAMSLLENGSALAARRGHKARQLRERARDMRRAERRREARKLKVRREGGFEEGCRGVT